MTPCLVSRGRPDMETSSASSLSFICDWPFLYCSYLGDKCRESSWVMSDIHQGGRSGLHLTLRCPFSPQRLTQWSSQTAHWAYVCMRAHVELLLGVEKIWDVDWCVMTATSALAGGTPLPPACPGWFVCWCLSPTVIDIPLSLPSSNNLRWPVFTGASADLLCHRMCWRFSGSMNLHEGEEDGEGHPGHKTASFNSAVGSNGVILSSWI